MGSQTPRGRTPRARPPKARLAMSIRPAGQIDTGLGRLGGAVTLSQAAPLSLGVLYRKAERPGGKARRSPWRGTPSPSASENRNSASSLVSIGEAVPLRLHLVCLFSGIFFGSPCKSDPRKTNPRKSKPRKTDLHHEPSLEMPYISRTYYEVFLAWTTVLSEPAFFCARRLAKIRSAMCRSLRALPSSAVVGPSSRGARPGRPEPCRRRWRRTRVAGSFFFPHAMHLMH